MYSWLECVLICKKHRAPGASQLCYSMANDNWAPWCQAVNTGPTTGYQTLRPPPWNLSLIVWRKTFMPVACWRSFCSAGSSTKEQILVLLISNWVASGVTFCLLESPPCIDTVLGDTPSHLELDCQCNLCRVQVWLHVTSSDTEPGQMQNKWKTVR